MAKGRKDFHVNAIKRSYRIRGKEARTQINAVATTIVLIGIIISFISMGSILPEKNTTVSKLIIMMLAYSAIKIRANEPLLYSVLNPETSSDSPSAKSNGVRFVSANVVVNQTRARGAIIISTHE